MSLVEKLEESSVVLRDTVNQMTFAEPVTHIYNPLDYAWEPYCHYLKLYANKPKKIIFMGMNPGPFGMAQVGVPFGEVGLAHDWMGVRGAIGKPTDEHPKRPIDGFDCARSEVSGRRLWGLFSERFGKPKKFFQDHFVVNYCPLVFMKSTGANLTPDKLPVSESQPLYAACDAHLRDAVEILKPEWLVAVGGFAEKRAEEALSGLDVNIGRILHPSPASPAANRDWAGTATKQMQALELWE